MARLEIHQLNDRTWILQGGGNIGILAHERHCLIVDSGMDKDTGKAILSAVAKLNLEPRALLITHAHADHFGGAHHIVKQTGVRVYATRVEASVMASPILEPLYLFSGAQPPRELQHKFLMAKPCLADEIVVGNEQEIAGIPLRLLSLPGHSSEQVGVAFGETLLAGDAFLTPEILDKHHIPFYSDIEQGLTTLNVLKQEVPAFSYVVAGHGEIYTSSEQANRAIYYTVERLEGILDTIRHGLAYGQPRSLADLLSEVAEAQGTSISTLAQHVLYQTTIQSALGTLYARGEIAPLLADNRLQWALV
ncbi:MBL fold metallo-hydrolase [Ktedonospora formicarum]|uniref:beta-lactamase n=1 Tax=Ktedonospora formicarum TaxID=2778364 RepID=A0A8J3HZ17_9CHLR|nr:MBL fold metallo-hydrolase [Ktedonospora formicarum]GHO43128.1 hydrolase [Ktedonospora formicarum]